MLLFNGLVENMIYLLFPILIYLLYVAYIRNCDKIEKNIFLELSLYSSLFLLIRFGYKDNYLYNMALFNIPLLIAYIKQKRVATILLSCLLIYYYYVYYDIYLYILIIEYSLYYLLYFYLSYKSHIKHYKNLFINLFIGIKSFVLTTAIFIIINSHGGVISNILTMIFIMIFFTVFSYLILFFLHRCEEVIDFNSIIVQLNKERDLHQSMFKITHEVKNPLAVCKGYLQMIDYDDKEKLKKYIPIISDEIDRSINILSDFSAFGKIKIVREECDLEFLIEETCQSLYYLFSENKIETEFNFLDEEIYMNIDYNRIKQVLVNLFKNCVEAKFPDRALKIILNIKKYKKFVKIIISDNGCGMTDYTLGRVFELFYTTKDNGTGLGVAFSKDVIEKHGGTLNYRTKLNKGTDTIITLPFHYKEKEKSL